MLYLWHYGDGDTIIEEVEDLKKAIREAHNYYNLRQSESSINQIFVIKKENYGKLYEENRWIADVASFSYDVVEIEKYKKYVHKILSKYYEENKNSYSDITFEDFKNISLRYEINTDYNFVRSVERYYIKYLDVIIEAVNNKII